MRKLCLRREIISDEMKNGSRMCVTLSAGEEPSSAFVKPLQTKDEPNSTFYSQTQTSNIFQMPNTVLMYKKNDEKDERCKEDKKKKKIKKLHTTPNLSVFRRGSGSWRAELEQQTSATLAEYLLLYTHEIQL